MGQNFFCTLQHKSAFTEQIVTKLATAGRHCVENFTRRILLKFNDKIRKYASKNSSRQYVEPDFLGLQFSRKSYLPDHVYSRAPVPNVVKIGQNRLMADKRSQTEGQMKDCCLHSLHITERLEPSSGQSEQSVPDRISWRIRPNKLRKYY